MLIRSIFRKALAAVLIAASPFAVHTASAQVDSALIVKSGGTTVLRVNVDGGTQITGIYDGDPAGGSVPVEGAGTRLIWYPKKAAFRAGTVAGTQWDAANIGNYSVAFGQDVRASADASAAFGLRTTAAQQSSFAAGEDNTASGAASVALGYHAHTNARQGSFVFSDRSSVDTLRAGVNHSANWRVSGGFRIFTASNLSTGVTIQSGASVSNWGQASAVISTSTGALLTTGGVWTNASDVNRKHAFHSVSGEEVLTKLRDMPVSTWTYKVESDDIRHIGPTAQDFHRAFGFGTDSLSIGTVDADGVSLAAIKALDTRTQSQNTDIQTLKAQNDSLRAQLTDLNDRLARLEAVLRKPQQ